jgi:hypothetical protein
VALSRDRRWCSREISSNKLCENYSDKDFILFVEEIKFSSNFVNLKTQIPSTRLLVEVECVYSSECAYLYIQYIFVCERLPR